MTIQAICPSAERVNSDHPEPPVPSGPLVGKATPAGDELERLFGRLTHSVDRAERERWRRHIITVCLPVADNIAYRFVGRGEPSEDLIQVARVGLIKTVDRYDPDRGHFLAFAVPTIRGEVRRYFRDNTWTVRVPRQVQETQLRMRETVNNLSQRLSRAPTTVEVAEELEVDSDHVLECTAATSAYRPTSLDAPLASVDDSTADTVGSKYGADDPHYDRVEDLIVVGEALAGLDPRRREIVTMIYFDCLTQREVARRLHMSQVHVSRLLNDTLTRIRDRVRVDVPAALCVLSPIIGSLMG